MGPRGFKGENGTKVSLMIVQLLASLKVTLQFREKVANRVNKVKKDHPGQR